MDQSRLQLFAYDSVTELWKQYKVIIFMVAVCALRWAAENSNASRTLTLIHRRINEKEKKQKRAAREKHEEPTVNNKVMMKSTTLMIESSEKNGNNSS